MTHIASDLIPVEIDVLRALVRGDRRFVSTMDLAVELDVRHAAVASALTTLRRRDLATDRSGPGAAKHAATQLGEDALRMLDADAEAARS